MRRLRKAGMVPAILYGHGEESVMLNVKEAELSKVIQHGGHVVELAGEMNESALIKDVQWDAFGLNVIHVDLTRINAKEEVEVDLPIELKGDAPGTHDGGVVNFLKHELSIACPANKLPDKIVVKINHLKLDDMILAGDIELPDGVKLLTSETDGIVSCSMPVTSIEGEEAGEEAGAAEPEIVGKDKEDESAAE